MKNAKHENENNKHGYSGRTTAADWLIALIPAAVFIVLSFVFGVADWPAWAAIGVAVLLLIAAAVFFVLIARSSRHASRKDKDK